MSQPPVVNITNLSKYYQLQNAAPADSLRELLSASWRNFFRVRKLSSPKQLSFPALLEVDLKVQRGEIVGIIGKNGAGKSTLLRILSRVTPPTAGSICLVGKVATLLEVGLGFHPDLTGRENVYLGGALLGLSRRTIKNRLAEIRAFAEIGDFFDVPVKKYSSGMYVRLAFAIATHLEADILLIDEVLAVGDAAFQQKCLQKIQAINRQGTTILFVSHNLSTIERLCQRCIVLHAGQVVCDDDPDRAIAFYRTNILGIEPHSIYQRSSQAPPTQSEAFLQSAGIYDLQGNPIQKLPANKGCKIYLQIVNHNQQFKPQCTLYLRNPDGQIIARLSTQDTGIISQNPASTLNLICTIPRLNLVPSPYSIDVHIYAQSKTLEYTENALSIEVTAPTDEFCLTVADSRYRGIVLLEQHWSVTN